MSIDQLQAAKLSKAAYTQPLLTATDLPAGWSDLSELIQTISGIDYFDTSTSSKYENEFRVFANDSTHEIAFAFKGSDKLGNFLSDLAPSDQGYTEYLKLAGKASAYLSLLQNTAALSQYKDYRVFTTGHSLGGAMAQNFAIEHMLPGFGQNSLPYSPQVLSPLPAGRLYEYRSQYDFQLAFVEGDVATGYYSGFRGNGYLSKNVQMIKSPFAAQSKFQAIMGTLRGPLLGGTAGAAVSALLPAVDAHKMENFIKYLVINGYKTAPFKPLDPEASSAIRDAVSKFAGIFQSGDEYSFTDESGSVVARATGTPTDLLATLADNSTIGLEFGDADLLITVAPPGAGGPSAQAEIDNDSVVIKLFDPSTGNITAETSHTADGTIIETQYLENGSHIVEYRPDGTLEETTPDGLVKTINLDKTVDFSDGTSIKADGSVEKLNGDGSIGVLYADGTMKNVEIAGQYITIKADRSGVSLVYDAQGELKKKTKYSAGHKLELVEEYLEGDVVRRVKVEGNLQTEDLWPGPDAIFVEGQWHHSTNAHTISNLVTGEVTRTTTFSNGWTDAFSTPGDGTGRQAQYDADGVLQWEAIDGPMGGIYRHLVWHPGHAAWEYWTNEVPGKTISHGPIAPVLPDIETTTTQIPFGATLTREVRNAEGIVRSTVTLANGETFVQDRSIDVPLGVYSHDVIYWGSGLTIFNANGNRVVSFDRFDNEGWLSSSGIARTDYSATGIAIAKTLIADSGRERIEQQYYPNGRLSSIVIFDDGHIRSSAGFYGDGAIQFTEEYIDGKLRSRIDYDEFGIKISDADVTEDENGWQQLISTTADGGRKKIIYDNNHQFVSDEREYSDGEFITTQSYSATGVKQSETVTSGYGGLMSVEFDEAGRTKKTVTSGIFGNSITSYVYRPGGGISSRTENDLSMGSVVTQSFYESGRLQEKRVSDGHGVAVTEWSESGSLANTIFVFSRGDGRSTAGNFLFNGEAMQSIEFGVGITSGDLSFYRISNGDLRISVNGGDDVLTLADWQMSSLSRPATYKFSNGTELPGSQIDSLYWTLPVLGTTGDDLIVLGSGNDTILGQQGSDHIMDAGGNDTYVFNTGDGMDTLEDASGSLDIIRFGTGISPGDVTVSWGADGDLVIHVGALDAGDGILVKGWAQAEGSMVIESMEFADGTTWNSSTISAIVGNAPPPVIEIVGTKRDDHLSGTTGMDLFRGGAGSDTLEGFSGNDIYDEYDLHGGSDTIIDHDATAGNFDVVRFGGDVAAQDVSVSVVNGDLVLTVANGGGQVTVKDWTTGAADQIERIEFADGTAWNQSYLESLLNAGNPPPSDPISGGSKADHLVGTNQGDVFQGNGADDTLEGQAGNDIYLFNVGDGHDVIIDVDGTKGNVDTVRFGTGIDASSISVQVDAAGDLQLTIAGGADQITVQGWASGAANRIEKVEFADGTIWGSAYLASLTEPQPPQGPTLIEGGSNDDNLQGTDGAELFRGNGGNDTLAGFAGNDVYEFNAGDGSDTIIDADATSGNVDTVRFGAGIDASAVAVQLDSEGDLQLTLAGGADQITIYGWGAGSENHVEQIEFSDGTVWDEAYLQSLLAPPPKPKSVFTGTDSAAASLTSAMASFGTGSDVPFGDTGNPHVFDIAMKVVANAL
ncbi:calcium-binding protein [Roseateles sp. P5_E1]